ncbi:long tail fiber protein distal subunit [Citrobacter phage vB_CfrM_CfP1]|uniref:Long tail fiber protein Gp37 n=1 Tax=Citrobacter phage vB_CfrM_CfP1 TaxID=1871313 RepID=A0A1B1IX75_9CAUD|nr:long tail fiber protein distal subunit [Citrobacter phage vB_CfrM_CfP1]ANS05926.1 small distal tail fiber subunit [Citrobacter phage vB_CfrM_CfP1]
MADLKLGTTLGGAAIWSASNLPLLPLGGQITYKGWRIYTENDRPTAEDIGALSLANGGTVNNDATFAKNITVGINAVAGALFSRSYIDITRAGNDPNIVFRRSDVTNTPTTEQALLVINAMNGVNVTAGTFNVHARPDGGNKVYITAYKSGSQNTALTLDSQAQQVTVEQGTFRVLGNTVLAGTTATTLNVTGALTAQTVTPANWTNHDVRYMTGIPTNMQGNTLSAAVVTEKNDVLSVNGNIVDGPYGNNTYNGQVVNFRRTLNTGNALTQIYLDNGVFHIRSGSGSPGAWSWVGGNANGWRKIYDENNKPTPVEIGALKNTTDTLNGELGLIGDLSLKSPTNRHIKFVYTKNDGSQTVDGYIYKDGPDAANRRSGIRINCYTPNKATGNGEFSGEFIFNENGSFILPSGGTIYQEGMTPGLYANSILSSATSGAKQYLRKFRGGGPDTIWHETVHTNIYRLATGVNDDVEVMVLDDSGNMSIKGHAGESTNLYLDSNINSVVWFRNSNGTEKGAVWAESDGKLKIRTNHTFSNTWEYYAGMIHSTGAVSGTDRGIIRGTPDGGGWDQWRDRSAAVSVDVPGVNNSAYSIWKATSWNNTYVAAMDVHMPNFTPSATRVRLVLQSSVAFYFDGDGSFTTSTGNITAGANGFFNDVYIRSDEKLKSNFSKIENALDKVELLDGLVYDKSNHIGGEPVTREAGLIAQQLQNVLPEAVSVGKDTKENEILTISPTATIALLVNAIKELREEVRELKARK